MLTAKQKDVLNQIQLFTQLQGRQPGLSEIAHEIGIKAKSTVHAHVRALIDQGYLQESLGKAAYVFDCPPTSVTSLPFLGRIAAGAPIEAIPGNDQIDMAAQFCGPDRYILRVSGDSMIEAGILDNDYVVIQKQSTAKRGEIVVALINHWEATLKFFHPQDTGLIELRPANQTMEPMFYPQDQVKIQGVMIGLFRDHPQMSFGF